MNDRSNPLLKIVCSNPNINGSKQLRFIQKKGLHRFSVSSIDGQVCGQSGDLSPQDIRQQFVIKTFTSVTRCSLDEVDIYQNSRTQERKSRTLSNPGQWHLAPGMELGTWPFAQSFLLWSLYRLGDKMTMAGVVAKVVNISMKSTSETCGNFNRMRTRLVLLWWFLFVDQYEFCDKESGNKGKSLQNHRSTCHPSGFDLLGNHSWGRVENQVDLLDAEAAPCHGAKKGREIWSPGRGGDCCVGRWRTLAGWHDSSQAVDRQEEAHWMRV